jgi:cysteine synthase
MHGNDILDLVGGTPTVAARRLASATDGELVLKLESFNPTGSVKDRAARSIVERAESLGLLRPGGTLLESTSGNFGRALSVIGAVRGYRVILVVDPKTPDDTLRFCRAHGAEIELVHTPDETGGYQRPRRARVAELKASIPGAFDTSQYDNPANAEAHRLTTGPEILAAVPNVDAIVAATSTGGHLSGIARHFKDAAPDVEIVAVDARGSALFCSGNQTYAMRGVGLAWHPENLSLDLIDIVQSVSDEEAYAACRVAARSEGIAVGESGGAVLFASLAYLLCRGPCRVVAVIADGAANYLRAGAYDDEWLASRVIVPVASDVAGLRAAALAPRYPSFAGDRERHAPAAHAAI